MLGASGYDLCGSVLPFILTPLFSSIASFSSYTVSEHIGLVVVPRSERGRVLNVKR